MADVFDYNEVKTRYLEQVKLYYANKKLPVVTPYTQEVVNRIKSLIKESQFLASVGCPSEHAKYKVAEKYEIIERNGEDILINKRLLPDDPIIQIVPAEDCFDILVHAHLQTRHGGREKMSNVIKKRNFVVPKTSIDFFIVVCTVCNSKGQAKRRVDERVPRIFNSRGQVTLVNMNHQPDNLFEHVLCYADRFTGYVLLRPLITNTPQETAMELLKIFFDFGPPEKIETYNRPFFKQVMSIINTAHSEFKVNLMLPVKTPVITPLGVKELLQKWQTETGSNNWAVGCYMVQWKHNSDMNSNKPSPYFSVFKCPLIGKSKDVQETETSEENGLNNEISAPSINSGDENSQPTSSIILDGDNEEAMQQEKVLSEDDEDCLITITENPDVNESVPTVPILSVPTVASSNKPLNHVPNILKRKLSQGSTDKYVKANETLLVLAPFKNVANPKNNNILKEQKQDESNNTPKPSNNRCHVCKTKIKQAYICTTCGRNVHLFCSDRLLKPEISPDILNVTCTSCTLTTGKEKMKRKDVDVDKDKTDVITIKD